MTHRATLAIALLFSAIAIVQYTSTASGQAGGGWITLFDGKNLDQWQGEGTATFKIEDGSVVARQEGSTTPSRHLVTKQSFKDFDFRAEFWVSDDANSGIFFRVTIRPAPAARPPTRRIFSTPAPIQATAPAPSRTSPRH